MGFQLNYQVNAQDTQMGFEPWPENWYTFQISNVEYKPTKDSTPQRPAGLLQIECMCIDQGPFAQKVYSWRLNIGYVDAQGDQQKQANIIAGAYRSLNALGVVVGVYDISNTDVLLGRQFKGKLTYSYDKDNKQKITGNNLNNVTDLQGRDPKAIAGGGTPQQQPMPGQAMPGGPQQQMPQGGPPQMQPPPMNTGYGQQMPPQQQMGQQPPPPMQQQMPQQNYGQQPPPMQQQQMPPQMPPQGGPPPMQQQQPPQQQYPGPQGGPPPLVPQMQQQQPAPGYAPPQQAGWGPR